LASGLRGGGTPRARGYRHRGRKLEENFQKNVALARASRLNVPAMRKVRSRIFLFATALGVLGLVGSAWVNARKPASNRPATAAQVSRVGPERMVQFETVAARAEDAVEPAAAPEPSRRGPVMELPAADAVQFSALCQLRLLAAETDLDLSHREWAKLATAVVHAQAVRLNYEAEIATVTELAPGQFRVEIPAYAEAGDELRRRFLADLREGLGEAAAAEVNEKLGSRLEGAFAGFGVSSQTLEITGDGASALGDVKVERTARYWNSADGGDRLTTRREVHFPLAEDPAGESWIPLLALVSKAD
jgi:hypothetical protein